MQLVEMLQDFCRISHKKIEVYFDNAPPGQLKVQKFGHVTVFFVRAGTTADQAIKQKLRRLGNESRNWSVVSSDREVQSAARAARATVIATQTFAGQLLRTGDQTHTNTDNSETPMMSSEEVEDWLNLFGESDDDE
jgi:predicted RNA-binding protein with PIN domain